MAVILVGLNHKTAPIEVREKVSYNEDQLPDLLRSLREQDGVAECALLSTCNRTELYAVSENPSVCRGSLTRFLTQGMPGHPEHLYQQADTEAINHLFSVSSGLDSMVLGENQILGQVKRAYTLAQEARTTGPILDKLFPWALKVGKEARSDTHINQGASSVSAAAIELAQHIFGDLKGRRVMILGAGKMSEKSLVLLVNAGVERITVANRTLARAQEMAERCGGHAVPFEDLDRALEDVDVLISSTGAPHYVVGRERLRRVMSARRGRPLFLVDIAVPRDIEPSCEDLTNVYLYNIDDLQQVVAENLARRHKEVQAVLAIVSRETSAFEHYLDSRKASSAITNLRSTFEEIRDQELERFLGRNAVSDDEKERLRRFSQGLLNKLLHQPSVRLRQLGGAGVESEELSRALEILGLAGEEEQA